MEVSYVFLFLALVRFGVMNKYFIAFFDRGKKYNMGETVATLEYLGWIGVIFLALWYQFFVFVGIQLSFVLIIANIILMLVMIFDYKIMGIELI